MIRKLFAVALLLGASASVMAEKVHLNKAAISKYSDVATKDGEIDCKIEKDSPGGIQVKTKSGKTLTVASGDVRAVEYDVGKGLVSDFRAPQFKLETALTKTGEARKKALNAELENFKELHKKVTGNPDARSFVEYKIAETMALLAEADGKIDVTKRDEAIKQLKTFADNNARRWTIVPALKTLARLQEEGKQIDGALETYKKLAGVVPKEQKADVDLLVGRLMMRTNRFKEAETQLSGVLEKMSDDNPQKPLVRAYLAKAKISLGNLTGVEKELTGLINGTSDARLRGAAYNLLGDLHYKAGKNEDAFWAYLRVDALYNEDPEEQAKALYYLSDLFTKIKKADPGRADDCARRLRDKRFAGTEYQARLIAEKGDTEKEKKEEKKDKDAKKDRDVKKDKKR
jgi:predicted negative regulator of RcsB-dependent stress response